MYVILKLLKTKGETLKNIVLVATVVAKENKADFIKAELNKLIEPTRVEAGNISYKIHQDLQNNHKFVAVETWADNEAIKSHMASDHFKAYGKITAENDAILSFDYVTLTEI